MKVISFFHLNLMYSSIEVEDRKSVINNCYWPLLKLIAEGDYFIGIEAPAVTLEIINDIDPDWIKELVRLLEEKRCEFIGSGYSQLIGPIVPYLVNKFNQEIGLDIYQSILGVKPNIVLVNEQAFSSSLVSLYQDVGYESFLMEWNNCYLANPQWNPLFQFYPQIAVGKNSDLPVLWNDSINFQKFQRLAHGEITLDEYFAHIENFASPVVTDNDSYFCLYGNDAEIFNFRPGRYKTEAALSNVDEWGKIKEVYDKIATSESFDFVLPSQVIKENYLKESSINYLMLTSVDHPITVKKQSKYNPTRWAISGRDDIWTNTLCYEIYEKIKLSKSINDWKKLCYLWSSDFRTHITEKRWIEFCQELISVRDRFSEKRHLTSDIRTKKSNVEDAHFPKNFSKDGRFLKFEGEYLKILFNPSKGLAIEGFYDKTVSHSRLIGTIPHGFFNDIRFGADYYTGHTVFSRFGYYQLTDLSKVDWIFSTDQSGTISITGHIETSIGSIIKTWLIDDANRRLHLKINFKSNEPIVGSFRLGYFTLDPNNFSQNEIFYETHNGGVQPEIFEVQEKSFDHAAAVSSLVSCTNMLGDTEGRIIFGDLKKQIQIEVDKSSSNLAVFVKHQKIKEKHLSRVVLSAMETDDTSKPRILDLQCKISISAVLGE
ncbi:glycoside hydrolase family 57 [Aquaspirillum serpens]|uniref:glycoside hydrolase family 57 n=1 Tax=Aquaspirillum serpens TaxID=190 RepID=UPI0003B66470|nr:glycoside hydrolase family 57 [Aquaspirillum serpens]